MYADFRNQFVSMVEVLSENDELKENGSIVRHISGTTYLFVPFDYEGKKYSQISEEIANGFGIRMRALWCHDDQEIMLILEYLNEDGDPKYQWMNDENAEGIEFFCIKQAAIKTFEILTSEVIENDDENIFIKIEDQGHGIPEEIKQNIFSPFFTTKTSKHGSGLGLSVVHGIVKNHNGDISIINNVPMGTIFKIRLPIS